MDENSKKTQQIGAELVVRTLRKCTVLRMCSAFLAPRSTRSSMHFVDSGKIETVVCRHEQNAAFIAGGGIGRMTGKSRRRHRHLGTRRLESQQRAWPRPIQRAIRLWLSVVAFVHLNRWKFASRWMRFPI